MQKYSKYSKELITREYCAAILKGQAYSNFRGKDESVAFYCYLLFSVLFFVHIQSKYTILYSSYVNSYEQTKELQFSKTQENTLGR